jgi:Ca2+-binding RTX toxin-like protein
VLLAAEGIRRVIGGPLRDRIVSGETDGAQLRVRFSGSVGDDSLVGGSHHDVLRGDPGDDHLDGRGGRDICDGGPGHDTVLDCEA